MLRAAARSLIFVLALPGAALADEVSQVTWALKLDGREVGQRTATYTIDRSGPDVRRVIEARTRIQAAVGPVTWAFEQNLVVHGSIGPNAFRSVQLEDGVAREVQGRWSPTAWTVVQVDKGGTRASEAAPYRIDVSTADLIDPYAARSLASFTSVKVLSAETGEILEGTVEPLGPSVVRIGTVDVGVQGYVWTTSAGRSTFWYDPDGWLVRYETTILGRAVEGVLKQPPPAGPDSFSVDGGPPGVVSEDL